ncbi:MAG: hypothetical protein AAGF50_01590 [Pseudomonadota bacterium]
MNTFPRTVALFYDGFETQALDRPFGQMQSEARRYLRTMWRAGRGLQVNTGYFTAFVNLRRSLEAQSIKVLVNDFAFARANPDTPVGISGYPKVFERVRLPNPAVFGPGYVPPPGEVEAIMGQCNIKIVTLPSEWPCKLWRPALGDQVQPLFVAIDSEKWIDLSIRPKSLDLVVYDKIRWNRDARSEDLLRPFLALLDICGITYRVLRYGHHHISQFRKALNDARGLAFLCEHETQGLAYQEAMASGIPVLAWDEGILVDPHQSSFAPADIEVSSVPYFDERCGLKFTRQSMEAKIEEFMQKLGSFKPRSYIQEVLSLKAGASRYLSLLERAKSV